MDAKYLSKKICYTNYELSGMSNRLDVFSSSLKVELGLDKNANSISMPNVGLGLYLQDTVNLIYCRAYTFFFSIFKIIYSFSCHFNTILIRIKEKKIFFPFAAVELSVKRKLAVFVKENLWSVPLKQSASFIALSHKKRVI